MKNTATPKIPAETKNAETEKRIAEGHGISKAAPSEHEHLEDKRETARHEHTNHFTNRAPAKKS